MDGLRDILNERSRAMLCKALDALRLPERVRIIELAASPQGTSTRLLGEALGIKAANISHHLRALEAANLIARKREHGTTMVTTNRDVARVAGSMLLVIAGVKPTEERKPATDDKRKGRWRGRRRGRAVRTQPPRALVARGSIRVHPS